MLQLIDNKLLIAVFIEFKENYNILSDICHKWNKAKFIKIPQL